MKTVAAFAIAWIVFFAMVGQFHIGDDTGSDLRSYTDKRTGCQYLSYGFSGLTPRMDASGKQVCIKQNG